MNKPHFTKHFILVTSVHVLLVGGLIFLTLVPGFDRHKPDYIPVELVVEIPPGTESGTDDYDPTDIAPPPAEPADIASPEPEPGTTEMVDSSVKQDKVKKNRKPAPAKGDNTPKVKTSGTKNGKSKIEISSRRVRNPFGRVDGKPPKQPVSAARLRELINAGAKAGDHTSEVNDETLYMETVKNHLYRAWAQPTSIDIDGLSTKVDIQLGLGGAVLGSSIIKSSGNSIMDDSVRRALESVRRISGLPAWFVARHTHMQVVFKLTEDTR